MRKYLRVPAKKIKIKVSLPRAPLIFTRCKYAVKSCVPNQINSNLGARWASVLFPSNLGRLQSQPEIIG